MLTSVLYRLIRNNGYALCFVRVMLCVSLGLWLVGDNNSFKWSVDDDKTSTLHVPTGCYEQNDATYLFYLLLYDISWFSILCIISIGTLESFWNFNAI